MMFYYEVLIADQGYKKDGALTYASEPQLAPLQPVSVPLKNKIVTAFVSRQVSKPGFDTKPIKAVLSPASLPPSLVETARWMSSYYASPLAECLKLLAPSGTIIRRAKPAIAKELAASVAVQSPDKFNLTEDQERAIKEIGSSPATTHILHGNTATGKTEVYIRLAKKVLAAGRSVIILTPEISLTAQLENTLAASLDNELVVLHSQLGLAERKRKWLKVLESLKPLVVVGTRSALFAPVQNLGLIVVDECHEPAYKQQQAPRYYASRVAAKLAGLNGGKAVLGSATPDVVDYYVAEQKGAVSTMIIPATAPSGSHSFELALVDLKDKSSFSRSSYLSNQLLEAVTDCLAAGQQALIYLNRRGTARLIMCLDCGWQLNCPRCAVAMVYHGDKHLAICHSCGRQAAPPAQCPEIPPGEISYRSIGTKAIAESLAAIYKNTPVQRFDSDNDDDERIEKHYLELMKAKPGIIVGTQLLAKGFDLPGLGMVGVVVADTSLFLPDYRADERTYQLLKQVTGRVGRGHGASRIVVQAYQTENFAIRSAITNDWPGFYKNTLAERRQFIYPPYCFMLKLTCSRATLRGAEQAAARLAAEILGGHKAIELIGPAPAFFEKRRGNFYQHIIIKSKSRQVLVNIARELPAKWSAELDPLDLL